MKKFRRRYRPTRIDERGDQLYVEVYPTGDELKAYEAQRKLTPNITTESRFIDKRKTS